MLKNRTHFVVAFALTSICLLGCLFCPQSSCDEPTRKLRLAVHKLESWLGQGPTADQWRDFLNLSSLETQSANGLNADYQQLNQIHQRFSSGHKSLKLPPFVEVREAIAAQLKNLAAESFDISFAIANAKNQYRQISVADLRYRRDQLVYDLKVLKKYYRSKLPSRERAEIFYDLKLAEQIEFLEQIRFELPPDISVGKLTVRLAKVAKQIEDVQDELNQLPQIEPTPPEPDVSDDDLPVEGPLTPMPEEDALNDNPNGSTETKAATQSSTNSAQVPEANQQESILESKANPSNDEILERKNELERKMEWLEKSKSELTELRKTVRKQDTPRVKSRNQNWRQLRSYGKLIFEVGTKRKDYYYESVQDSFTRFALLYLYGTDDNLEADYIENLELLDKAVQSGPLTSSRSSAAEVGDLVGWFEAAQQAPEVVRSIERNFSKPNLYASISQDLVNRLGTQTLNDGRRVNELVLGRLIRGEASTKGTVNFDFIDNPNEAMISIHLFGSIYSQTYTVSGPFTGFAGANGIFDARQTLRANIGGLLAEDPYGAANLQSEFYGVDSKFDLVQKIARKQYLRDKTRAEGITTKRIETELMDEFREQTSSAIDGAKERFSELLEKVPTIGGWIPELFMNTRQGRLNIMGSRSTFRLGLAGKVSNLPATSSPPFMPNSDISLRIHESLLSNYVDEYFNNRKFTNIELVKTAEKLTGTKIEGVADEEEDSWSITFSNARPIQFEFENNRLSVTISGRRFSQGSNRISDGLKIKIPFKVTRRDGDLFFGRDGEATIEFLDRDKRTPRGVAFKSFMETLLNKSADAEDGEKEEDAAKEMKPIRLPENLVPVDQLANADAAKFAEDLQLNVFSMENGWLNLGWNYLPGGMTFGQSQNTPAIWQEYRVLSGTVPLEVPPIESDLNDDGPEPIEVLGQPVITGSR